MWVLNWEGMESRAWNETLFFLCLSSYFHWLVRVVLILSFQSLVYSQKSIALAARDLRFMWTWYDWVKKGWRSEWALNKAHENGWLENREKKITYAIVNRPTRSLHKIYMSYDYERITHEMPLSSFLEFDQLMQWVSHVNSKSSKWKQ